MNAPLQLVSDQEFLEVFKVNVCGTHNFIKAFLPSMTNVGHGIIINFDFLLGTIYCGKSLHIVQVNGRLKG